MAVVLARLHPVDNSRRRGFTLVEVLVVVGILALLAAILLPSLARAREQSRSSICLTQLQEMGRALHMYGADYGDSLPGPLHVAVELETHNLFSARDYEAYHLPFFLRKYFGERGRRTTGKFTDRMVSCPTAVALSSSKLKNTFDPSMPERTFSYAINNFFKNHRGAVYGTDPPWYFGSPDDYWVEGPAPFAKMPPPTSPIELIAHRNALPKKISVVRQPSREWAIGDAFNYETPLLLSAGMGKPAGQWQIGTYQNSSFSRKVSLPTKPYHAEGVNLLCFDGHAEWQRPWRGTTNGR